MAKILIIDDDEGVCETLSGVVEQMGHNASSVSTLTHGLERISSGAFDVVFLDVRMPDGNGLDILPIIREIPFPPEVIIMTGAADPDGAELAIKSGAWDYIEKPSSLKGMTLPLIRALQYRAEKTAGKSPVALKRGDIVGNSQRMKLCFDLLAQAANSEANVLITGETGTGKELFAKAIHANSLRAHKNFVVVDCAALPETLIESSLFGFEKGAFTGADKAQVGLITQADGGTLFLDEVGELTPPLQKAFLRVLQERRFRPIGGKREIDSDFRLLAATNRDLETLAKKGQFREDLLFRLRSIVIELPVLRERKDDIKELVMHYTTRICDNYGKETKGFSPDFLDSLYAYDWPGNVRELVNTLEGAIAEAQNEPTLFPKHLPVHVRIKLARASVTKNNATALEEKLVQHAPSPLSFPVYRDFRETALAKAEKKYFQDLMVLTKGNIMEACRISGLGRTRLYALIKKHNISRLGWSTSNHE